MRGFYEKNRYARIRQIADCLPGMILYYLKKER